ncbi:putative MFS family arabinose efflux permease [Halopolyspora algeriensis]|uniref:Putative MFS family arabinose efflux permease n=1 Tax=Halopolyspora algeriensis TaxID=1500506 RepID=A0A368VET5_9ACTN|nr:OFA family MFS transporter [Halopolyspora algeriensis]RCW38780.1 putative MFS family arabinose efflux permease [Halopolyspora algeriensis]TQM55724.1 putative MFS family arabinose efflux permease [Halopolyspora algeriensis]
MSSPVQQIRDHHGRRYRIGEQPRELMGRSRTWMLLLCWAPMLLVGTGQYAYGAALPSMATDRGWPLGSSLWPLAVWTIFQAGAGYPVAHLRQRHRIGPRPMMILGALLCLASPLTLAHAQSLPGMLVGYSVLGGTGAGLIYATCTSTVAKWYPERAASRVSAVTGAFAYGSVPFIVALVVGVDAGTVPVAFDGFGMLLFAVVLACGMLFTDPPRDWWPSHIDPRQWASSGRLNPGRLRNPPAVRQYTAAEALRTPALPVMYACLFCAGSVSLFNAVLLVVFTTRLDYGPWSVAVLAAAFAGVNGAGRALAIRVSDRVGRRRVLAWSLGIQGAGQFCLLLAAAGATGGVLAAGTVLAGLGGGAFYPLFASLAREFFGENSSAEVHGVIYSAKAFSGVAGVGMAVLALGPWGCAPVFAAAGFLALCSAVLTRTLRRPGMPRTLP